MFGKFIVFEGIDGAGKTTQVQLLCERFAPRQSRVRLVQDGIKARPFKANSGSTLVDTLTARTIDSYSIKSYLEKGITVICDRWDWSTLVYQRDELRNSVNQEIYRNSYSLAPDLYVYLDIEVDRALSRIKNPDKFETKENLIECLRIYRHLTELDSIRVPYQILSQNGSLDAETIHKNIVWFVNEKLFQISLPVAY